MSQEQMRLASSLKVRAQCLEDDNNTLNQRLEALSKQKYHLEKVMKELQLEKEKEVMFLFEYNFFIRMLCNVADHFTEPTEYSLSKCSLWA